MKPIRTWLRAAFAAVAVAGIAATLVAQAQAPAGVPETTLRRILGERVPQLQKIDEITKAPMPGLYEIRVGSEIFYSDADGNFLIQGFIFDTRAKRNLTEERQEKLMAVDFNALPLKDAFTVVRGTGKRKVALFEDPNCGYCKRMERDLQKVDNVTLYVFLYPILGPDSNIKSRQIWCAKDKGKAWIDWMTKDQMPRSEMCDVAAIERNVELGRKHRIAGTPTMFLADGTRVPGAVTATQFEKLLADAK